MLECLFNDLFKNVKIDPGRVDDIVVGNVLQPGAGTYSAKIGQMFAKIPFSVPIMTINRFCSSGIEAMSMIAAKIKAGYIDCGIGAGMENMSIFDMTKYFIPLKENLTERTYNEKDT
jgi:acetyl-CoA acyltransferase 1